MQGHNLSCLQRAAEKTFLSTKGHEGPRRKPLQGHNLGCPHRAAEKTFFDPRRATKDHEENLCKIINWAVHKGPRRKPFLSTKGHEGPRRKPLQGHNLGCTQRAAEKTFFVHEGPRRAAKKTIARSQFGLYTKGRGENLLWSTQIMVLGHENQARNGLVLPTGVLSCHNFSSLLQISREPSE